ncbi:MAG TPA: DUF748 domain-containing protein [Candidatus Methylomirabilis sp.]
MPGTKRKKWGWIILAMLLVLVVGGAVGYRIAVGILKGKVVEALGPGSEIQDIQVGWSGVVVRGLRIKGPQGWPAQDALRTERVTIVPSLLDLLSGEIRVRSVTIEKPYLSALRAKDGKLRVVPTLLERPAAKGEGGTRVAAPPVHIATITLRDGVVELFDATVAKPPLKLRLEQLQASVRNALVPALTGKSDFDLTGILKGVRQDGRIKVGGWAEGATKDSTVKTELRGVDLVALQPYLSKAAEVRVQKGLLDLDIQSDVRKNRLRAPGRIAIAGLEFAPSQGAMGTFMGVPRGAVLAFLKDKGNRIAMDFIIEGDINNPQFSLNEAFSTRMAVSMAETLGVSIQGVAEGVGTLGRKGAEALGGTAKGIGDAIGGLFGVQKK